jgi:tetratricopeptide (TPR) repeat protein
MSISSSNFSEEFEEVYQRYDWNRFLLDLSTCNGGDGLSPQQERCLKGIALDLPRKQIAAQLDIKVATVKDYLKKPYRLIEMLFSDETTEGRMNETRARSLILNNYKKSQLSVSDFVQDLETNNEANENEALEDIDVNKEHVWQTIDEIEPYIGKFHELCENKDYMEAFYTIFDVDDYDNCVYKFLSSRGYLNILISLYEKLIESWSQRKSEKWEFLKVLTCLGDAYSRIGHYEVAVEYHQRCLEAALEIEDIENIGGSAVNLGLAYYYLKDYEKALDYSRKGLEIAREISERELESIALNNLGLIYSAIGEYRLAIDYYHFSLEVGQKINDLEGIAGNLINIGSGYRALQQHKQAHSYIQLGIAAAHKSHHKQFEANGWFNLGLTLESLNQYSDAICSYEQACILYRQMEMFDRVEDCEMWISIIHSLTEETTLT